VSEPAAALHGVRITVAYDGGGFSGFAAQPGRRTVQGVLAEAAARVCRQPVVVRGASRTDAGVHALGQVAAFACARNLAPERWTLALNRYLPEDVAVRDAAPCPPDYDPRFDARDKTYRYLFHLGRARHPLLRRCSWHVGKPLYRLPRGAYAEAVVDLAAMREACAVLTGTHDFRAFRAAADERENTTRTLLRLTLIEGYCDEPALLAFEVQGTAFMMNMVRILAGTLIDVGRGRLTPAGVAALLGPGAERRGAGTTAPAHGLTLVAVTLGRTPAPASRSAP
jgi:tRNA pseudouridine38-40 synthase